MTLIFTAIKAVLSAIVLAALLYAAIVFVVVVYLFPIVTPGLLLTSLLNWRLAQPDPFDRVAVARRTGLLVTTLGVSFLASIRVALAVHDDVPEPAWGVALVVAGALQIASAVATLPRNAPWRRSTVLARTLCLHYGLGLALIFARPLLDLFG